MVIENAMAVMPASNLIDISLPAGPSFFKDENLTGSWRLGT